MPDIDENSQSETVDGICTFNVSGWREVVSSLICGEGD